MVSPNLPKIWAVRAPQHPYDGGIVIQAGETPQLGDINRGLIPEAYQRVAQVLKPIRFDDHQRPLIDTPRPLDPLEETMKWVRRFD